MRGKVKGKRKSRSGKPFALFPFPYFCKKSIQVMGMVMVTAMGMAMGMAMVTAMATAMATAMGMVMVTAMATAMGMVTV